MRALGIKGSVRASGKPEDLVGSNQWVACERYRSQSVSVIRIEVSGFAPASL
jgi:hypothetical protein